jgi:hypothetical protein
LLRYTAAALRLSTVADVLSLVILLMAVKTLRLAHRPSWHDHAVISSGKTSPHQPSRLL